MQGTMRCLSCQAACRRLHHGGRARATRRKEVHPIMMPGPMRHDTQVIRTYTRAQALADGALIDLSPLAAEAGFRYPVLVTTAVWQILEPSADLARLGQSATVRAWDMLQVLRAAIRHNGHTDRIHFAPLFLL